MDRSIDDLEFGLIGGAERARDDVASRPRPGLVLGDDAAIDELLDLGVVARHLREPRVAIEIGAAVAAPDAGVMDAVNDERDQRRADDPAVLRMREAPQLVIDADDLLFEFGQKGGGRVVGGKRVQRLHHRLAGDVAVAVAAHTVRHRPKADRRPRQNAVLIVLANPSDVADAANPESEGLRHVDSPKEADVASANAPVRKSEKRVGGGSPI